MIGNWGNGDDLATWYVNSSEEVLEAKHAISVLGMQLDQREETALTNGDPRESFTFKKVEKTPSAYPRNYGQIKKKPL